MEYESFMELAKKRRSSWEFRSDPVPDDTIEKIVDAARYSPSGFNSQPWEFIVIKEQELRDKIIDIFADHLPSQGVKPGMKDPMGFKTAPVFIILFGDPRVRPFGPPPVQQNDDKWSAVMISSLAISFQYMHLAAASLGLASKWVSAINMTQIESKLKALLGIPGEFMTYDMMALGYSDFQPHTKKMRKLSEVIHFGQCSQDDFRTDEEVRAYFNKEESEKPVEKTYEKLIEWLRKAWWGLPDSEHLMPTMMAFYAPEEAALLTGLPFSSTNLDELAEMKGMDAVELGPKMDALAKRGAVGRSVKGGMVHYSLKDSFFTFMRGPFWASKPDNRTKETASPLNKYFFDAYMDQFEVAHTKGLRAIPIDQTIEDPRRILPYEDVVKFVDTQDYCTVSLCPCRQRNNLDPDSRSCEHGLENCLHFGDLGRYIVDNGLGREITKEETKKILKQAAEAGLVHGISNWQEGADTLCNCCRCCCLFLEAYHILGHHKGHDASNYIVRANQKTCIACGLCVDRCPMDALQLEESQEATNKKGKAVVLDAEKCIGCGVCVYKCPSESLVLECREEICDPPKDVREWTKRWFADNKAASKKDSLNGR